MFLGPFFFFFEIHVTGDIEIHVGFVWDVSQLVFAPFVMVQFFLIYGFVS